ncbi:PP2C family protein-serine/threonine phosphatase [Paeniglutamicibacter sp.]|uniref:PP2C family protein-serine/threonine phosphatase n=1 Tax=Paeniglutamicibacter sp. TaxID=1934391 RepID=UPI00398A4F4D
MRYGFGQVRAAAATDIGLRRAVNEDSVLDAGTVFAVADGMGGHEAGDLASRLGIETLNELAAEPTDPGDDPEALPHARDVLAVVTEADARIRLATGARGGTTLCVLALVRVEDDGGAWPGEPAGSPVTAQLPAAHGAGLTEALHLPLPAVGAPRYLDSTHESGEVDVDTAADRPEPEPTTDVLPRAQAAGVPAAPAGTAAMTIAGTSAKVTPIPGAGDGFVGAEEDPVRVMLLNVGDSRGYRLRDGVLTQLTRDHSAVQELIDAGIITEAEARIHPQRNLITRALGAGGNSVPDTQFHLPRPGDRYLLCTDGLTGEVEPKAMEEILALTPDRTEAVGRLIDAALASGGRDNISVVIVDIEGPGA